MAKYNSSEVGFLLIDGYAISGISTEINEDHKAEVEDTTGLGVAAEINEYTGILASSLTQAGYFDDAALSSNEALVSTNGASRVVCYNFETNTIGKNFVGFAGALQVKYSRVVKVGELHKFNAEYTGSGAMENGKVVHQLKNETSSSGNTQASSIDNGASSEIGRAHV